MTRKRIACVIGTRPEAIKMAPVIKQLRASDWAKPVVLFTGQHRELALGILSQFGVTPDIDLDVMRPNQSLSGLASRLIDALGGALGEVNPDLVLAQGDTTSVLAAALCSFYRKIPFGHVEAGLRSDNFHSPFPEEMNRILVSKLSTLNFAPTGSARDNLIAEAVCHEHIYVTGNTVIDALLEIASRNVKIDYPKNPDCLLILVTAHRRENFGDSILHICDALIQIHDQHSNVEIVYPVHPNPNIQSVIHSRLNGFERIFIVPAFEYVEFVALMNASYLILTDSGGIQEEAPALRKPVIVLRNETERSEGISEGVAVRAGTSTAQIVFEVNRLLQYRDHYDRMACGTSIYGDGHAAKRIVDICESFFAK